MGMASGVRRISTSSILRGGRAVQKTGKWNAKKEWDEVHKIPPLRVGSVEYIDRLKRYIGDRDLYAVKRTHARIINAKRDQERLTLLGNHLVHAYGRCGSPDDALAVFKGIAEKNGHSWAIMMGAYQDNGKNTEVLELFKEMVKLGVEQNQVTFVAALRSCASLGEEALAEGKQIHGHVLRSKLASDLVLQNSLINMYSKCGSFRFASCVFERMERKNVISYTAMISAYAHYGYPEEGFKLYKSMVSEGIRPDTYTYASALSVCPTLKEGRVIHSRISSPYRSCLVVANALVSMYGRFGRLEEASKVYDGMRKRDIVSSNAMISAYAKHDDGRKAISLYVETESRGFEANIVTFTSVLEACAKLGALVEGKEIHARIVRTGLQPDVALNTALVNMYAKCGVAHEASIVFNRMRKKNVFTWTAMIGAYTEPGQSAERLELYHGMHLDGVVPDDVTFTAIFNACSHAGLPDEGWKYFISMRGDHGITPLQPHYVCMVDLLGRVGRLKEAEELIRNMPFEPDVVAWTILLSACKVHGNLERGVRAAKQVFALNPEDSGPYSLLANIYAKAGKWNEMAEVKELMLKKGLTKQAGRSYIEAQRKIHEFVSGDTSHPLNEEIREHLMKLHKQMVEAGYVPDTKQVLCDVKDEEKQQLLCYHSERLAIGLGLLVTDPGTTLHVIKNLRVCPDCHTATKFISKLLGRKILVRDSHRFHCFQRGSCSCGDYW